MTTTLNTVQVIRTTTKPSRLILFFSSSFENKTIPTLAQIIIIIIIITFLFREDDILSNTNYLSDIWSSMIKIMKNTHNTLLTFNESRKLL